MECTYQTWPDLAGGYDISKAMTYHQLPLTVGGASDLLRCVYFLHELIVAALRADASLPARRGGLAWSRRRACSDAARRRATPFRMESDRMRGAVLTEVGKPLEIRDDLVLREPGPGEVLVALRASGVCHSDLSLQNGTLTAAPPVVLGHEGAGEILATGPGVTDVAAGDHVILVWIPPCGRARCAWAASRSCARWRAWPAPGRSPR